MKLKFFIILFSVLGIGLGMLYLLNPSTKETIHTDSERTQDTIKCNQDTSYSIFINEMYKGVQGDFTLEEVDSMMKSWEKLDSAL